jgi:hypothetical protein
LYHVVKYEAGTISGYAYRSEIVREHRSSFADPTAL